MSEQTKHWTEEEIRKTNIRFANKLDREREYILKGIWTDSDKVIAFNKLLLKLVKDFRGEKSHASGNELR